MSHLSDNVDVGIFFQQQLHDLSVTAAGGTDQTRVTAPVL